MPQPRNSSSDLYGKAVFTTIAIRESEPLFWPKHWARLVTNSAKIGVDLSDCSEKEVQKSLSIEIQKNGIACGRARIALCDERSSELWAVEKNVDKSTSISILVDEKKAVPRSFRVSISPFLINSRSPLAGVKSCNYLEQILSLDEAKGRGFQDAARVNERGHVPSGCVANIFWFRNGPPYTPTLATGCLAGTTREYVLENIECEEVEAEIGELESAEAIYLTSAGLGIVRVAEFDGRELPDTKHPIQTLWPPS